MTYRLRVEDSHKRILSWACDSTWAMSCGNLDKSAVEKYQMVVSGEVARLLLSFDITRDFRRRV